MAYETPPRGSGRRPRHAADPSPYPGSAEYARGIRGVRAPPPIPERAGFYYPPEDDLPTEDEMPTDPTLRAPLNFAPTPAVSSRYQDLVVPRVYVEPDESMDRLRSRALRWAIARDILAVIVLIYAIGWMTRPVWSTFF